MKKAVITAIILLAAAGAAIPSYAHRSNGRKHSHASAKKYTCSMHPEVVSSRPGKCSKCGMKLELVKADVKKK